jgi:hypothetical protein
MNYAVEMGSGTMIYILSFIRFVQPFKSCRMGYTNTETAWRSHKPKFLFLQNTGSRLKAEGLSSHKQLFLLINSQHVSVQIGYH